MFFWRNNEVPHFFWRNNEALDFSIAGITFAGWEGFRWTVSFFVSDVSFENVAKVIGFIHVFANGEKSNCLCMSVFWVFAHISSGNDFFE